MEITLRNICWGLILGATFVVGSAFTHTAKAQEVICVFSEDQCHHLADHAGHQYQMAFNPNICPQEPHYACYILHGQ